MLPSIGAFGASGDPSGCMLLPLIHEVAVADPWNMGADETE